MVHGYISIKTILGKAHDVTTEVSKVEGADDACAVTDTFDIIATFDVKNLEGIANVVVKEIHRIEDICETQTAICVACK